MTARGTDQSCSLYPAVSFFAGLGTPFAPPGRNENREGTIFLRSVFHGFRDGPQRSRAAPPAATFRRPGGAETANGTANIEQGTPNTE